MERLTEWGISHETGLGGIGVVAAIEEQAPEMGGDCTLRGYGYVGNCGRDGVALKLDLSGKDACLRT